MHALSPLAGAPALLVVLAEGEDLMIAEAASLTVAVGTWTMALSRLRSSRRRRPACQCRKDAWGARSTRKCPRHNPAFVDDLAEEAIGTISGSRVAEAKRRYLETEDMTAADFIALLEPLPYREAVTLVAASAAVLGQSSAAVLGGADLYEYAGRLKASGQFAGIGEPVHELGREKPVGYLFSPMPGGGCSCAACQDGYAKRAAAFGRIGRPRPPHDLDTEMR